MRRLAVVALALALVAACSSSPEIGSGWSRVTPGDFAAELAAPKPEAAPKQVIVDVREPELFAAGHIPGAINMPWPNVKQTAPVELNAADDIVIVCHGGPMGDALAEILVAKGFTRVRNIAGGMDDWTGPTER